MASAPGRDETNDGIEKKRPDRGIYPVELGADIRACLDLAECL